MTRSLFWRILVVLFVGHLCSTVGIACATVTTVEDYDADGYFIRRTEAADSEMERVTEYAYTDGNLTTITKYLDDGSTLITEMQYDDAGNLIWRRDPSGRETLYTYQNGNLNTVHTDQGVWEYVYDSENRLWKVVDPFGNVRERAYDADGNVSVVKVNGDIVSTYTYTGSNLTQRTDALGQPYTFEYNDENQLIRQEDPEGAFTEFEYDEQGRLRLTRDALGNEIVREYAVVGSSGYCPSCSGVGGEPIERLHKIIYPTFTKEFVYDSEGRVSEEIYHLSAVEQYTVSLSYDAFGRLESTTDPDNQTTTYSYDLLGRRISVTDSSGTTQFEYDLWDNLVALTDAENQRTEFEYYPDGKLKLERRPMGEETTYEYDRFGRLWKIRDAKDQTTEYGYDDQWRLKTIAYADGKTVTLSYNADSNLSGYSDGVTSATYTYDAIGRKLTETVHYGPFSKSFAYSYYGNGLKQTFTSPDSTIYTYNYGTNNELREVQIPGVGNITISEYTWNWPATINYPGGTQCSYGYDALMRLESLSATDPGGNPLLNYAYTHDEVGNILTKQIEHGLYGYDYDAVSRLISADNPVLDDEAFTYDGVGNRETASGVSGAITHNANNELTMYGEIAYEYDANGNMIRKSIGAAAVNYLYDASDRLVRVEDELSGTVIVVYGYDPFGRRLWKEVGGTRTYFFYSDEGLVAEYDENGVEMRSYGYKPDSTWTTDPLFLKEGGAYYWYQNDHLGTPQKLTNSSGVVVWSAQYSSFGKTTIDVNTVENPLRFPGQYEDTETGLYYNWFRYYDPRIGRYIQADPLKLIGSEVNGYQYVKDNPAMWFDPPGLLALTVNSAVSWWLASGTTGVTTVGAGVVAAFAAGYAAGTLLNDYVIEPYVADPIFDMIWPEGSPTESPYPQPQPQPDPNPTDQDTDEDDCCTDDRGRTCKICATITYYVILPEDKPHSFGHAFLEHPNRKGNIVGTGWSLLNPRQDYRRAVRGHVVDGSISDDSDLLKDPERFLVKTYKACPESVQKLNNVIDQNSSGLYHLYNEAGRNCYGWAAYVLQEADFRPPFTPPTRSFSEFFVEGVNRPVGLREYLINLAQP